MAKGTKMKYHLAYGEGFYFLCTEGVNCEFVVGPIMKTSTDVINRIMSGSLESVKDEGGDESFNKEWRWSVPKEFL